MRKTHGGYRSLKSYQTTTIMYDLVVMFCDSFIDPKSRTHDQMIQATRSGRQNTAEGSQASLTSKKTEIKLVGVARASQEELLIDCEDFLRQRGLKFWTKDDPRSKTLRELAYMSNRSSVTYVSYMSDSESAANCLIYLIHQANYLLDHQLSSLDQAFLEGGGFTENLSKRHLEYQTGRSSRGVNIRLISPYHSFIF